MGAIDYWCNGFTPEYRALWDAVIGEQDLSTEGAEGIVGLGHENRVDREAGQGAQEAVDHDGP